MLLSGQIDCMNVQADIEVHCLHMAFYQAGQELSLAQKALLKALSKEPYNWKPVNVK